jgi:hypothetical protein
MANLSFHEKIINPAHRRRWLDWVCESLWWYQHKHVYYDYFVSGVKPDHSRVKLLNPKTLKP